MERILPKITELTRPYWDACRDGELLLQQCADCGRHQFYPRIICNHCMAGDLRWVAAAGTGEIASFTVVRRAISRAYEAPYIVALIDLTEGVRMMSLIVGTDPDSVAVSDRVSVDFEAWSPEVSLPVFRLN